MATEITLKSKVLKCKKRWWLYETLRPLALIIPFLVLCIINHKEYFVTSDDKWSCGVGFVIIAVVTIFSTVPKFPKVNKYLFGLIGVVVVWLFKTVVHDLVWITTLEYVGFLLYSFFTNMANKYHKAYDDYILAIRNREVMNSKENIKVNEKGKLL